MKASSTMRQDSMAGVGKGAQDATAGVRGHADDAPVVSVIVPVYNAGAWIGRCLDCLCGQTLRDFQVIFVDDCSTDASVQAIERAAAADNRIGLVRQERNAGPGPARNAGIAQARGRYLTFLDVDDRYGSSDYLEVLCNAAGRSRFGVAGACLANEHARGRVERDFPEDGLYWGYTLRQSGDVPFGRFQFDYGFHRFVFRRDLFCDGANRFPGLRYYEDPVFLVRILAQAGGFFAVPDREYLYRCDFRRQNWSTDKVLDYLEGVRGNLAFSRERELARLHWATAARLDWECGKIGVGLKGGLDLDRIECALQRVEAEVDEGLLAQMGRVELPFRFQLRRELEALPGRTGVRVLAAKAQYGLVNGRLWHALRPYLKR